jgi:hypothetical protein
MFQVSMQVTNNSVDFHAVNNYEGHISRQVTTKTVRISMQVKIRAVKFSTQVIGGLKLSTQEITRAFQVSV